MPTGFVSEFEVKRYLDQIQEMSPIVQTTFKELTELYEKGDVTYDKDGPHTKFNLRYVTHPMTNLTEARAMDLLVRDGYDVTYITDKSQYSGVDLQYRPAGTNEPWTGVSVKICTLSKYITVQHSVHRALLKEAIAQVMLVDNINKCAALLNRRDVFRLAQLMRPSQKPGYFWATTALAKEIFLKFYDGRPQ